MEILILLGLHPSHTPHRPDLLPHLSTPPASSPTRRLAVRWHAQAITAHEFPRTTKLYDRTSDQISLDEIERIQI